MFTITQSSESLRFWAPTGLAGAVATASVALLTTTVLTAAPSSAYPVDRIPAAAATVTAGAHHQAAPLCFMGRHNWNVDLVGPQPRCPR